jgi:hypothetical protein
LTGTVLASASTSSAAYGEPPVDVSDYPVYCNSIVGKITFASASITSATAGASVVVNAKVDDCDIPFDPLGVEGLRGTLKGTLSSSATGCDILTGLGWTGTLQMRWRTASGTTKVTDDNLLESGARTNITLPASGLDFTGDGSNLLTNALGIGDAGDAYRLFKASDDDLGGVTTADAFSPSGINMNIAFTSSQTAQQLADQCAQTYGGNGVRTIDIGIGELATVFP